MFTPKDLVLRLGLSPALRLGTLFKRDVSEPHDTRLLVLSEGDSRRGHDEVSVYLSAA